MVDAQLTLPPGSPFNRASGAEASILAKLLQGGVPSRRFQTYEH